jgi:hypothetical protein
MSSRPHFEGLRRHRIIIVINKRSSQSTDVSHDSSHCPTVVSMTLTHCELAADLASVDRSSFISNFQHHGDFLKLLRALICHPRLLSQVHDSLSTRMEICKGSVDLVLAGAINCREGNPPATSWGSISMRCSCCLRRRYFFHHHICCAGLADSSSLQRSRSYETEGSQPSCSVLSADGDSRWYLRPASSTSTRFVLTVGQHGRFYWIVGAVRLEPPPSQRRQRIEPSASASTSCESRAGGRGEQSGELGSGQFEFLPAVLEAAC